VRSAVSVIAGLEIFVRTGKKLPCAGLYDVVEGYIKISAECCEIVELLEGESQSVTELMLIFRSLELILLRTASDLSHFSMVGTTVVKKILSTHAKLLQSSLCSVNHQFVRQCLSLLSAMVSQGANSAREVFSILVFSKSLNSLARQRDRTVVHNPAINKSQKLRFFSAATLAQIASLYKWNGIVDSSTVDSQGEGKLLVRELVHNFLLDLCCSHKHGIGFHDPSLGTATRAGNLVLLQFVVGLKQATEDELVCELLVSILKCSPDILPRYFKETHFSFTPRVAGAWLDSVALLKKIYEAQSEVSQALQLQEAVTVPRLLSMVLITSLPPVCTKSFFNQGFKVQYVAGQHATVSILAFILRRAEKNMEYSLKTPVLNCLDTSTPTTMEEFVQLYRESLSKILPDVTSIVSVWQSLSKTEKEESEVISGATGLKAGKEDKVEDYGNNGKQNPKLVLLKALLLQVLCLYQRVVPHLISQSKFDFSKLLKGKPAHLSLHSEHILKGIITPSGLERNVPPVLQFEILKLALELPASKFSWFRLQEVNPEVARGEGSVFHLLLKMFISSSSIHLRTLTRMLVLKVLRDSGVFEHSSRELELWVDHLQSLEPPQQDRVIQFLDQALMRVMCNPYIYLDKVAAVAQEALGLQAELSGRDREPCDLPGSHITDTVIQDGGDGLEGSVLSDDVLQTFPFSALVPAVLETRNKLLQNSTEENSVCEYICAVLCDVLHCQRSPVSLCLTLQQYDKELLSAEISTLPHPSMSFCLYYSKWLPQQPQETWVILLGMFKEQLNQSTWLNTISQSASSRHFVRLNVLTDSITEKLANTSEELQWRTCLITAAFQWLSATYKEQKETQVQKEKAILRRLRTLLISPENVRALDWNVFVKCGLKYRYQDREFLTVLEMLLEKMYGDVNASKELLAVETLHMMVTSHSLFLPTMLAFQNEENSSPECKEALVSLLLTLVKKCPQVCNSSQVPVLLGAYGATLDPADQKLLLLLREYETINSQAELQCLLWGPEAVEFHKARKQLGPSLWQQPSSEQVLAQLAPDRMLNTVTHFPLHRCLIPQEGEELICTQEREGTQHQLCLYDPCFLLPLFSFILRPESVVDCQKFVSCHALAVTVVALSSRDLKMRSAASHVLTSFYEHLEGARFRGKKQILYLMDTVRNGIQKQNFRLSLVHTTYIAKVAQQMLRPEEHMYLVINRFLLGTQYMDLGRIPDFFKLFYSFDFEHKLERQWMLSVLEESVMDKLSFDLCEKQNVYHALLGFCSSPLCEQSVQVHYIFVLFLINYNKLVFGRCPDGRLVSAVIALLYSLWFFNLGQKDPAVQYRAADDSVKCFTFPVINDFLCALLSVIRHLRNGVEATAVQLFVQTLASVLKHHKKSLGAHTDAGWLTVPPHTLSCSSSLSVLHCWATLTHDQPLLSALQALAKTHNIKGLFESVKERVQGKASAKLSQSHLQDLDKAADGGLEACRPLLMSILTHWEPQTVLPSPSLCNGEVSDSSSLVGRTGYTLIKWTLKTLCEGSYEESSICAAVEWLHRVILSHKTIAQSLVSDEAVKVDLLRLYHQTCQCRVQSSLDTLQLLTTVMLHLLEVQGVPNVLQTSKMEGYLDTPNLLSLYIHELWNGGKVPQLLLTHVQLVTRDEKKSKKKPKAGASVLHLCKDVLSALNSLLST
uniref:URB1 ribosome biogenesis homolog n=1 Tax=Astyanax mexicanus TaxID=7994 RepID=A0A8B9K6W6_ASTMX